MTPKDDDSEDISKSLLEWLTRVGAIATILATIFALFFPNLGENAKKLAYLVAFLLLIGSSVVYYFRHRRSARTKAAEIRAPMLSPVDLVPSVPTAILRGPIPFEEGEQLPLRERDVQQLYTLIASSTFRFGVLWGESGCGKTSLLRAGLVPALQKGGFLPVYVPAITKDPQQAIFNSLKRKTAGSISSSDQDIGKLLLVIGPKWKKVIIILDQFEDFFLANPTSSKREKFIKWMSTLLADANSSIVFLVCIRASSLTNLQEFASYIPESTSPNTTYQLLNFDVPQAKQILVEAAKVDGIPFESELIDTVVHDLERDGSIRVTELQIVGARLKRKNIYNLDTYVAPILPRVLLIIFNPIVDATTGKTLIDVYSWHNPDELTSQYIRDIQECSDGLVNYQIVESDHYIGRENVNKFPVQSDGFQYQIQDYLSVFRGDGEFHFSVLDYEALIKEFNLLERVANNEFDEVWLFGFPSAGFFQSTMAGKGAFFCNGPIVPNTKKCPRRFLLLGFNYERSIGEMLETLGHRAESIMQHVYRKKKGKENLFEQYTLYDKIAPGQANMGTIHYAPNSIADYDWANMTPVRSFCDDWYHFPKMTGMVRQIDATAWGSGDIRLHHKWWLSHLPKAPGVTGGIANNWWKYIIDPNKVS